MQRNHQGSCHCGAVRFSCDIDLSAGTSRCNCSICGKSRFWKAVIPASAFRLEQGEEALTDYRFGSHNIRHLFCRVCGVKPFGRVHIDEAAGFGISGEFCAVNVVCLDGVSDEELAAVPVAFEDGRNNAWQAEPAETRHL